jgi:hypothetical protein
VPNAADVAVQCLDMLDLVAAGVAVSDAGLTDAFTGDQGAALTLLVPDVEVVRYMSSLVGFIGEFALTLWLLIIGVRKPTSEATPLGAASS